MQIKATASFETAAGELTGGIVLDIEWLPDSEHEDILLKHLLSDSAHDSAEMIASNFGVKYISKLRITGELKGARAEMALFSEWKAAGGNYPVNGGKAVSFEQFKAMKAAEVPAEA